MKNFIIGTVVALLAFVIGVMAVNWAIGSAVKLGANPGPDYYNLQSFHGGMVQGGDKTAIAAASTTSLTAKQVCDSSVITFAPTHVMSSTTLPTSASLTSNCLQNNGDTKRILFRNISVATSTTLISVASTTATTLLVPTSTTAVAGSGAIILGGSSAFIDFFRNTATQTIVTIINLVDGD